MDLAALYREDRKQEIAAYKQTLLVPRINPEIEAILHLLPNVLRIIFNGFPENQVQVNIGDQEIFGRYLTRDTRLNSPNIVLLPDGRMCYLVDYYQESIAPTIFNADFVDACSPRCSYDYLLQAMTARHLLAVTSLNYKADFPGIRNFRPEIPPEWTIESRTLYDIEREITRKRQTNFRCN